MKIALPRKVMMIIKNLQLHGYEAYAVGGCVRDSILARRPKDWDITTSARPEEVKKLFRRTVDTGIEHGTVTVLFGRDGYEVTTYRIDGAYEDSRHPKEVLFTNRLEEDLRRRDFTINAMAYNDEVRLVDVFGGMQDLNHHLIRCVGDPRERFSEDALRILRAVRFSAQLNFPMKRKRLRRSGTCPYTGKYRCRAHSGRACKASCRLIRNGYKMRMNLGSRGSFCRSGMLWRE